MPLPSGSDVVMVFPYFPDVMGEVLGLHEINMCEWSLRNLMVGRDSTTDHKRNRSRKVYYSQVLEEVHGMPQGATQEVKAECRQRGRPWGIFLYQGLWVELLWGSQARAGLVNSGRKSGVWVLSQGRIRHTGRGDS